MLKIDTSAGSDPAELDEVRVPAGPRAFFDLMIVTGSLPVPPPTTMPRLNPRLLSFEADLLLSQGRKRHAEWLSRKAEAMREAGR